MKSERPDNDEDAAAGTTGEPPENAVEEVPEPAEPTEPTEPEKAPAPDADVPGPSVAPEPEGTPGPAVAPAAEAAPAPAPAPEPEAASHVATPSTPGLTDAPDGPDALDAPGTPEAAETTGTPTAAESPETPEAPEPSAPPATPEAFEPPDAGDHPARHRSPALVIASVAAAVLLIGGGGAYLASSGGNGSGGDGAAAPGASGGSTPPPLALDGYSSSGGGNGIAPGEPNPYGVSYTASGTLPGGPGSAAVYQPSGAVSEDRVAALAKALGVDGTPVAEGTVWKVGTDNDGSGGSLQVNRAAPGIWTYSRYAPGTDNCKSALVCAQDPAAPAGDPVSVADAEKAAAPVLKALGQDDAKLDAGQVMGAQRVVNADPVVGGLPTYGWTTGLTVSKQGEVVGGNGMLGTPAEGATYPVLSAAKTLDLMNAAPRSDHRMGIGGCASPVPLKDRLEQPCAASTPSSAASPSASSAVIEKAVFGLAAQSVAGQQALVPSWLFQVRGAADSYTVTYPAVDPKYLASASTPSASASATQKNVKVDGYTAEGRDLTVAFTGGVCADYKATVDEGSEQVVVKVTETPWPDKICILIAKQYHQTVRLDAPLDGRKVVGTDGGAVPKEKATTLTPQDG
ncbi:hypothetical protein [Streptomyces sp. NPDC048282]|uniref:hypothetical protein n=1 Tax=Streptomyces sp. NPDC048282 TaxID=3365528 RepID=UPI00371E938C